LFFSPHLLFSKSQPFQWLWRVFWSKFCEMASLTAILTPPWHGEKWLPSLRCYFGSRGSSDDVISTQEMY
jgi:hypothetical protein